MSRTIKALAPTAALTLTLALPAAGAPLTYPSPVVDGFPDPGSPPITAASWILYDDVTDTVLGAKDPDTQRAVASVTKIMTGLLTLENSSPDEIVTVSENAAATGEKEIDLVAGEQLTMDAMFKALMIHSANDAATAIAEHISGSVEAFVGLMNQRATELGLTGTSFANPHGLDAPGHHSSARDLLTLGRIAMEHPGFAEVVRAQIVLIPPAPDGTTRRGTSTNMLLDWYEGTLGVKTGFTNEALLTYVGAAERDGRRVYAVVLGSDGERAHFFDAIELFDYAFRDLGFYGTVASGSPYVAAAPRMEPDPLIFAGQAETYVHLARLGLNLEEPQPLSKPDEPPPTPVVEVTREPARAHGTLTEALDHWYRLWLPGS